MLFDSRYLRKKAQLAAIAFRWSAHLRMGDARTILRDRVLGYEVLRWEGFDLGPCKTIIDVGANTGAVSAAFLLVYRPQCLIAIEPHPELVPALRRRFANAPCVRVVDAAASDSPGRVPFFLQDFNAASSLFPIHAGYLASAGLPEGSRRVEVQARRLDDIAEEAGLGAVDLLKLDCQGSELRALLGAPNLLQRTRAVLTEVTFEPVYAGGAMFSEVHSLLRGRGFRLNRLDHMGGIRGGIDQADALYLRE